MGEGVRGEGEGEGYRPFGVGAAIGAKPDGGDRCGIARLEGTFQMLLAPLDGGRATEDGSVRLDGPLDEGMAICEGRGTEREPLDRAAGRQMCSPSEERGIGAAHDEQVTVGRTTEARSISWDRGARRDIAGRIESSVCQRTIILVQCLTLGGDGCSRIERSATRRESLGKVITASSGRKKSETKRNKGVYKNGKVRDR